MRVGQAADIVVRLDRHRGAAGEGDALDHVGIERALRQEIGAADLLGLRIEHVDEQPADGLALLFGIGDALELAEEKLRCINMHQRDVVVMPEQVDHGLGLVEAQQAVIDEDAGELVADRLVDQHGGDRGIDAAGEAADHPALADLGADLLDRLLAEGAHGPVAGEAGDLAHEIARSAWRRRACAPPRGGTSGRNICGSRPGSPRTARSALVPATEKPGGILVMRSPWLIQT